MTSSAKIDKEARFHCRCVGLHRVLSELEWKEGLALEALTFIIVDRGAPEGTRLLRSPEVVSRDRSYLHLEGGGQVPYHRVVEVRLGDQVVWSRTEGDAKSP